MHIIQYVFLTVCALSLFCLLVYGLNCYFLIACYHNNRHRARKQHQDLEDHFNRNLKSTGWPRVTVQLPVYNERYVVVRLIDSICKLDYPADRLQIQVLDDSTDDSAGLARNAVRRMQKQGIDIVYRHRKNRSGFKAGALRAGLATARADLIAIFDADFVPDPDFLRKTVPHFSDPKVGMIQTRWGHLNPDYSLLTRAQSIGIDGHFGVEQASRAWGGLFMNFNGTAGIWRKQAIKDAGGWQADTLTEDLDLSYRAQLSGWRLMFADRVVCPAEIPVSISAFKSQQYRWAKGSIQTARKNMGRLFRADLPLLVKIQAFLHLTHYLVHPMMLVVVLASVPMLYNQWFFDQIKYPAMMFAALCLATCGPSSLYIFSQRLLYPDWKRRIKYLPFLMCLGTGIAVNNTRAVMEALCGVPSGFVRTPKYGIQRRSDTWNDKKYAIPLNPLSMVELFLGLYSLLGLILFVRLSKFLVCPFLLIYTIGFFYVFSLTVKQARDADDLP